MVSLEEFTERVAEGSTVTGEVESFTIDELSEVLLRLLERTDDAFFHATSLFRELVLDECEEDASVANQFRQSYFDGKQHTVVRELENRILHRNLLVRRAAVYTLGKVVATSSLPRLWDAFDTAVDRYPDIVLDLAMEIYWLEGQEEAPVREEAWIEQLVDSKSFWNRWAAVEAYSGCGLQDERIASRLRADEHPYVANLASKMIPVNSDDYTGSRLAISWIAGAFRSVQQDADYTVADFEAFADAFMAKHAPKLRKRANG